MGWGSSYARQSPCPLAQVGALTMGTLTPTLDRQSLDWLLVLTSSVPVAARSAHPRKGGPHGTTRTASRDDRWGTRLGLSVAAHLQTACRERPLGAASVRQGSARPLPAQRYSSHPPAFERGCERLDAEYWDHAVAQYGQWHPVLRSKSVITMRHLCRSNTSSTQPVGSITKERWVVEGHGILPAPHFSRRTGCTTRSPGWLF
jgi:hypothetical protein